MKKTKLFVISGSIILALSLGLFTQLKFANAQTTTADTGGQALEIAPPVIILTADPGQVIETQINLRDVANNSLIVKGQINDFVASGEDGIPKIILEENEPNPYSIKNWVSPMPELTLESKQMKNLPVKITVPSNAAPGGYYGVVRFTATPPELDGTGLSLSASLGALILLRVNGDVTESLAIEEFSINRDGQTASFFESTPINFVVRLKNNGSVHEQPSGQVTITDMFGNKVATVNVNLPKANILPDSIRKFEQPLNKDIIGDRMLFGRYKADLLITYGSDNNKQTLSQTIEFWVIPYRLIAVIVLALVGGFIGLFFLIKRYNHYIVGKAQRHRR